MVTSEIYRTGPDVIAHLLEGLTQYLERQGMRSFDEFVASCKSGINERASRQSRVQAMLDTGHYRDPHPEPVARTGDKWGHLYPSPHDE